MAKPDRSIDPRILKSAKEEFLQWGFDKASLKRICERAGVTTGALYNRFKGKEELFCSLVEPAVRDMRAVMEERKARSVSKLTDQELVEVWKMERDDMMWWFRFLEERRDEFVLLISRADGSGYADFQHDWVETMTETTWRYYEEARKRGLAGQELSRKELHILLTAFWTTIYEPFIHGCTWEELERVCDMSCRLFNWHSAFQFTDIFSGNVEGNKNLAEEKES